MRKCEVILARLIWCGRIEHSNSIMGTWSMDDRILWLERVQEYPYSMCPKLRSVSAHTPNLTVLATCKLGSESPRFSAWFAKIWNRARKRRKYFTQESNFLFSWNAHSMFYMAPEKWTPRAVSLFFRLQRGVRSRLIQRTSLTLVPCRTVNFEEFLKIMPKQHVVPPNAEEMRSTFKVSAKLSFVIAFAVSGVSHIF